MATQEEGDEAYLETFDGPMEDDDAETESYGENSEEELVDSFDSALNDYSDQQIEASDDETYSKVIEKEEHYL